MSALQVDQLFFRCSLHNSGVHVNVNVFSEPEMSRFFRDSICLRNFMSISIGVQLYTRICEIQISYLNYFPIFGGNNSNLNFNNSDSGSTDHQSSLRTVSCFHHILFLLCVKELWENIQKVSFDIRASPVPSLIQKSL